ncbi:MAG: hypothetical protein PQJ47_10345 [Sphaerochaetaceae bacterium]|nr:hypothetical protein [Sphaerochaetaceae bacterium]
MKKISMIVLAVLLIASPLFADFNARLNEMDTLFINDKLDECRDMIDDAIEKTNDPVELSELYWRLSRVILSIADELEVLGAQEDELYSLFEEGEMYADKSIELHENAPAYVYKASNIGRWGELKGPLNALSKADPIRETIRYVVNDLGDMDQTIGWYVIGQLYYLLPGWPISYGNQDIAISVARKAVDTIPKKMLYPGHFKALAVMLWDRNWSSSKRNSKIKSIERSWKKESDDPFEQTYYYEGSQGVKHVPFYSSVALNKMSDRQEAVLLLNYALAKYEAWPIHTRGDKRNKAEIDNLLKEWGF